MSQTPAKPEPSEDTSAADRGLNRAMLGKLAVVVVMMFGFGYALVPLYKKICEVTNINVLTTRDYDGGALRNTQVDQTRTITVEFDSNSQGPFRFRPVQNSMEVHPGEISQIVYEVVKQGGAHGRGSGHPELCAQAGHRVLQEDRVFLLQAADVGRQRIARDAGGVCH